MSFLGDFSEFPELWPRSSFNLRNYDPKIHQNLQNYGYQFFGQNGTSPSDDRSRYPPPPSRRNSLCLCNVLNLVSLPHSYELIDLLAILQKSLDRAIFLYNFIREVR